MRFPARSLPFLFLLAACAAAPASPAEPVTAVSAPRRESPVDPDALAALRVRARAERSAALLLWVDGEMVVDESYGNEPDAPLVAMSVSKSVVVLRIGQLVEQGALELDAPLSESIVPEWKDPARARITLRHLLDHTSGLDPARYASDAEGFRTLTIEGHIPAMASVDEPGARFAYNNAAVDMLAVVARRADPSGRSLDVQLEAALFEPMGIGGTSWLTDGNGDPRAAGELLIHPRGLLAIGQLMLDRGRFGGQQLVPASWVDTIVRPGPYPGCGLLWWLDRRDGEEAVASWVADGYLGQYIVVVPEARAVAVRMRDGNSTSWDPAEFSYPEFRSDVLALFEPRESAAAASARTTPSSSPSAPGTR